MKGETLMKSKFFSRGCLFVLAAILTANVLTGCGTKTADGNKESGTLNSTQQKDEAFQYPIKGNPKLTYYTRSAPQGFQNYSQMPWYKVEAEKTGVTVEYIHPVVGQEKEQFNLMIASGDMPDIVRYDWKAFSGGPEKAISDGTIISLNEAIDNYAPNLKKVLQTYSEVDKSIKTDSNKYYTFPMVRTSESLVVYAGLIIRKDWLEDLGLEVPETLDEWYAALKAFKEKKGADAPLTYNSKGVPNYSSIAGAFGISSSFYLENGKVKYGPYEPSYKNYLALMAKWYKEGLIDPDIATVDKTLMHSKILNGKSGAIIGLAGGDLGTLLKNTAKKDEKFDLAGAPYPVLKKGDKPQFGQRDGMVVYGESVAISKNCKNIEAAVRFLDWYYTEEGMLLQNFGIEGQSYQMQNGYPKYINLKPGETMPSDYIKVNAPGLNDPRYFEQSAGLPQQQDAVKRWAATDMVKHMIPAVIPTPEEASQHWRGTDRQI